MAKTEKRYGNKVIVTLNNFLLCIKFMHCKIQMEWTGYSEHMLCYDDLGIVAAI